MADAIRDCSHRNGIILDSFGGAGTTLIAAEKTGRRARLIEIDPRYVDVTLYGSRILAFDIAAARIAGALSDLARSRGATPGFADIVIAATARSHRLIVLTRNTRHFEPLRVPTVNPFDRLPSES